MQRLFYVLPSYLVLVALALPLIVGGRTLYLRDVLNSHYSLKAAQAETLRDGELPLVDVQRGGGQPLLGNLNAAPLYPDNLLYLFAPTLWAFNAHFWLHLLIAPWAFFWLGRAWGLGRPAAWAGGLCYATSGFFLSQLNLYNLVVGATLAPAFIAACLTAWRDDRDHSAAWIGGLWALLLLGGEPLYAALALALGASAAVVRHGWRPARPGLLALAFGAGSLVALPQIVELLRILPLSYRGYWQYSVNAALAQSWDPRSLVEWLLPLFFGLPDFSFWGRRFHGGNEPLFFSLYPGLLSLALVFCAGRPRDRAMVWAWSVAGLGLFLSLGAWNPLVRWLYQLPGASTLRYPVKLWLLVAVAAALLCGIGFERFFADGGRRRLLAITILGLVAYGALWAILSFGPIDALQQLDPQALDDATFAAQRLRWAGLALLATVLLGLFSLTLGLRRLRLHHAAAFLLLLHAAAQVFFLRPLVDSDTVEPYQKQPPLLSALGEDERIVHGGVNDLFGRLYGSLGDLPDLRTLWLTRRHFAELYPFSGIQWGRRYDFNPSPEGLDSFFHIALARRMQELDDTSRVRLLAASGVDVLILDRELDADARDQVRLRQTQPGEGHTLYIYELAGAADLVQWVGTAFRAPHMNAAVDRLTTASFDPRTMVVLPGVVLPGSGEDRLAPPGSATVLETGRERLTVETSSADDGFLVVQRSYLELYRASVDGIPAAIEVANVHRMAIAVPSGEHRVELWVDRRPTRFAWAGMALGILILFFIARGRKGRAAEA